MGIGRPAGALRPVLRSQLVPRGPGGAGRTGAQPSNYGCDFKTEVTATAPSAVPPRPTHRGGTVTSPLRLQARARGSCSAFCSHGLRPCPGHPHLTPPGSAGRRPLAAHPRGAQRRCQHFARSDCVVRLRDRGDSRRSPANAETQAGRLGSSPEVTRPGRGGRGLQQVSGS